MAAGETHGPSNVVIWIYLVVLAIVSVFVSFIFPAPANTVAIFALAIAKAVLVLLYFMHLRVEKIFIHSLFFIPLFLVVVLYIGLMPDILRSMY
jgi:cytochrome c oxidase subunit 4